MSDRELTRDESLELTRLHADIERLLARAVKLRKGMPPTARLMFYPVETNLARAELEIGAVKETLVNPYIPE